MDVVGGKDSCCVDDDAKLAPCRVNLLPSTTVRPHGRFRACHAQAFRTPRLQTPLHTPSLLYNRTLSPFQTSFLSRRAPILFFF